MEVKFVFFLHIIFIFIRIKIMSCDRSNHFKIAPVAHMEGFVVGGEPVSIERYPYATLIFNMGSLCAGSIINSWAVLTAAHCFIHNDDVAEITVHAGTTQRYDEEAAVHNGTHVVIHERYNVIMPFACDIALLFVETPFEFGKKVQKAIMADNMDWIRENVKKDAFTVTGWGMVHYDGPLSELGLLMTHLRYVPLDTCGRLHGLEMSEDMFCLYGDAKRDTCKGDSGGGVLWHNLLVGIVSHGDGCAGENKPSVYVNVVIFRAWIQEQMENYFDNFCINNTLRK